MNKRRPSRQKAKFQTLVLSAFSQYTIANRSYYSFFIPHIFVADQRMYGSHDCFL